MPRRARARPDDACFHVLSRGHAREPLFHVHDPREFATFRELLARYRDSPRLTPNSPYSSGDPSCRPRAFVV